MAPLRIVVTGFSSFQGVESNPTEVLVEWLAQHLRDNGKLITDDASIAYIGVLKVSAEEVDSKLPDIWEQLAADGDYMVPIVWVHLGVSSRDPTFRLESTAYNEANFRVPDEAGWQPSHLPIDHLRPLGAELTTRLPVHTLCADLASTGHEVEVSTDPGRFVCNYVYYRSLQCCAGQQQGGEEGKEGGAQSSTPTGADHPGPTRSGAGEGGVRVAQQVTGLAAEAVQAGAGSAAQAVQDQAVQAAGRKLGPARPTASVAVVAAAIATGDIEEETKPQQEAAKGASAEAEEEERAARPAAALVGGDGERVAALDSEAVSSPVPQCTALFVHVPPFSSIAQPEQEAFVLALLKEVAASQGGWAPTHSLRLPADPLQPQHLLPPTLPSLPQQ